MSPVRLTLSALGAPVTGRVRGLRRRLRARRAWKAGAPPIPDQAALPEPFLYGDGDVGRALVAGRWLARGHEVELGERPIWAVPLPDPRLEADRDAFEWLGDLAALGTRAARSRAQAWTLDWVRRFGRGRGPGWRPERAGRRMLNWTAQLRLMTEGLRGGGCGAGLAGGRHAWAGAGPGLARGAAEGAGQVAALAGSVLGLALVGDEAADAAAIELAQLSEQVIDGVGATPSRAPGELADMVILLIWTARVLEGAGMAARPGHLHAIARAVPVIRALRLGDGSMARFHGGGPGGRSGSTRRSRSCASRRGRSRGCRWAMRGSRAGGSSR
jgi:uncharacterized heparinase superfamily protein